MTVDWNMVATLTMTFVICRLLVSVGDLFAIVLRMLWWTDDAPIVKPAQEMPRPTRTSERRTVPPVHR